MSTAIVIENVVAAAASIDVAIALRSPRLPSGPTAGMTASIALGSAGSSATSASARSTASTRPTLGTNQNESRTRRIRYRMPFTSRSVLGPEAAPPSPARS